ncbi:hypothetical protein TPDSL_13890 [Terrisporobacter petrolearius]|uniref:YopX family protein n=1 Tax=Terrisporobacter petrolearius TaxID=1460447 RepID=UPI0033690039
MRDIKFRFWNGTCMNELDDLYMFEEDGMHSFEDGARYYNYIFMQYTGLKDKNGKEIYEGDILSYKHIEYTDCSKEEIEDIEKEVLIGLITYRPLASIIKPYGENVKCFGYDNINKECLVIDLESEELEVIGNIYENPELLEG